MKKLLHPTVIAVTLAVIALCVSLLEPGCATTKNAAVAVATDCAVQAEQVLVSAVRSAALASSDKQLPDLLAQLEACAARSAAAQARAELVAISAEAGVAAQASASTGGMSIDVGAARLDAWLALHGGPPAPVKAGLPGGGGGIPFCCFHPGTDTLWTVGEFCGGVILTSANYSSICSSGRCPERRVCSTGH